MITLRVALQLVLLVLTQAWILNSITMWGYAFPMLYLYLIIGLPVKYNKSIVLVWAFLLGMSIDAFAHSYGVNTSATVLIAFLRPYLQQLFFDQEDFSELFLSADTLQPSKFYKYATSMVLVHHTAIFLLESLSFSNPLLLLVRILCSSLFTMLLILGVEMILANKRQR